MENRKVDFVPSQRGGKLLQLDGYLLSINRKNGDRHHWKCRRRNCTVTAITQGQLLMKYQGEHIHEPDETKIKIKKSLQMAKEDARNHPLKPIKRVFSEAFNDVLEGEAEEAIDDLTCMRKYRCTLYRARSTNLPKIPHHRCDIELPEEWTQTKDGRPFLLANDGEEDKILIFGTAQNLRHLCSANEIYMDGTFKSAPEMFRQLYSIHVEIMDSMVPVVYALLPKKDKVSYTRMFHLIGQAARRFGHQFQPSTVCIDFEMAVIETIQHIFPNSRIRGCLFHYSQAIWRKVQELGLSVRYKEDMAFNRLVRRASALPLVPLESIDSVWMEALNEVNDDVAVQFMDYVTLTWVDRAAAMFPVEMWNQYDKVDKYRTNNHLEAWHGVINRELGRPHPNLFKLIDTLKEKQHDVEHHLRLMQAGAPPPVQRNAYKQVTERLIRLKTRLEQQDISVYHYAGAVAGALKQSCVNN